MKDEPTGFSKNEKFEEDMNELTTKNLYGGPVSVAVFDIDLFMAVNTNYGHETGDEVIRVLGDVLNAVFSGKTDQVYRLGGDEFAVIQDGIEKERAFLNMESARKNFESEKRLDKINPHPTISAGVAAYPDDGATKQEVLRKADDALFRGKQNGRNKVMLAREEKKIPKTSHYTQGQLERLSVLSGKEGVGEAELLREALDDLLKKYSS